MRPIGWVFDSCANISGATASTYTPVAGDVGHTLRVVETVSKSGYNNGSSTLACADVRLTRLKLW